MVEFFILIDYFVSRSWKEEIVKSSGRNTPRLRQMLGVYKHNICRIKKNLRNDFLFSVIDGSDTSLLRGLHSSFLLKCVSLFVLKKEERKRRPPKPLPWFFRLSYFILYTLLFIREIWKGLCIRYELNVLDNGYNWSVVAINFCVCLYL